MFGFCDHYVHEMIQTPNGTIVLIDVADTWDCGWEGAYAIFDEDTFREWWKVTSEEAEDEYTIEDIEELGEEAGAFNGWEVVSSHHRNPDVAERNVRKAVNKL